MMQVAIVLDNHPPPHPVFDKKKKRGISYDGQYAPEDLLSSAARLVQGSMV